MGQLTRAMRLLRCVTSASPRFSPSNRGSPHGRVGQAQAEGPSRGVIVHRNADSVFWYCPCVALRAVSVDRSLSEQFGAGGGEFHQALMHPWPESAPSSPSSHHTSVALSSRWVYRCLINSEASNAARVSSSDHNLTLPS